MRHLAEADWIERLDPPSHRFRIYQSMDDLSVYEPEYEPEEVVIANGKVRLQVLSVVPPPLEYMATLHADRQEISGRQVWTGSLALAHVLEQHEPAKRDLQAKRILELGSGTGILGMSVSKLFNPEIVVLTDGDPKAVELLEQNLDNPFNEIDRAKTRLETLVWGNVKPSFAKSCRAFGPHWLEAEKIQFDSILGGDVLYKNELPVLFFITVKCLLKPNGVLWLCHIPRSTVTQEVVVNAAKMAGFQWEVVDFNSKIQGCPVEDANRARVYRLKLNP